MHHWQIIERVQMEATKIHILCKISYTQSHSLSLTITHTPARNLDNIIQHTGLTHMSKIVSSFEKKGNIFENYTDNLERNYFLNVAQLYSCLLFPEPRILLLQLHMTATIMGLNICACLNILCVINRVVNCTTNTRQRWTAMTYLPVQQQILNYQPHVGQTLLNSSTSYELKEKHTSTNTLNFPPAPPPSTTNVISRPLPWKKLLTRRQETARRSTDSLSSLEMTSGGNGSRLASRSSSAFSLSLCRLDGLVFSLEEDGFLMMRRAEGRQTDGVGRVCEDRGHALGRGYKNHLATWPSQNIIFFPSAEAR